MYIPVDQKEIEEEGKTRRNKDTRSTFIFYSNGIYRIKLFIQNVFELQSKMN